MSKELDEAVAEAKRAIAAYREANAAVLGSRRFDDLEDEVRIIQKSNGWFEAECGDLAILYEPTAEKRAANWLDIIFDNAHTIFVMEKHKRES